MDKKTFALNAIRPYAHNPQICGFDPRIGCLYVAPNGNHCVVGQYMKNPQKWNMSGSIDAIINTISVHNLSFILQDSVANVLTLKEWTLLQDIHDSIARINESTTSSLMREKYRDVLGDRITQLNLFTYEEMMAEDNSVNELISSLKEPEVLVLSLV